MGTAVGMNVRTTSLSLRPSRPSSAAPRLHPDGRDLAGQHPPDRLPAGVEIGGEDLRDGVGRPGHDGAVHGATVLYPSDATSAAAFRRRWPNAPASFTCAPPGALPASTTPPIASPSGDRRSCAGAADDTVTLIGAGVTLHAAGGRRTLAADGIDARVIDLYSVKPMDAETLRRCRGVTNGCMFVVEDHHPEGGLGSAVTEALLEDGPAEAVGDAPGRPGDARLGHRGGADGRGRASMPGTSSRPPAISSRPSDRATAPGRRCDRPEWLRHVSVPDVAAGWLPPTV